MSVGRKLRHSPANQAATKEATLSDPATTQAELTRLRVLIQEMDSRLAQISQIMARARLNTPNQLQGE